MRSSPGKGNGRGRPASPVGSCRRPPRSGSAVDCLRGSGGEDLRAEAQVVGHDPDDLVVVEVGLPGGVLGELLAGLVLLGGLLVGVLLLVLVVVERGLVAELLLVQRDGVPRLAVGD